MPLFGCHWAWVLEVEERTEPARASKIFREETEKK